MGELCIASGQNRSASLACVTVASGSLFQPWKAAEPVPSSILGTAFCIGIVQEVKGGWICRSQHKSRVPESSIAMGGSGQGCSWLLWQDLGPATGEHKVRWRSPALCHSRPPWSGESTPRESPVSLGKRGRLLLSWTQVPAAKHPCFITWPSIGAAAKGL